MSGPRGPQQGAEQLRQAEEEELGQVDQVSQVCCCVWWVMVTLTEE